MNCRARGGDGNWRPLACALTGGYSQVEATADCYLDKQAFFSLPSVPPSPFKASGTEIILVSYSRGKVVATPGFEEIKKMESFVYLETGVRIGIEVTYTVDLFTGIGSVILMHHDSQVLARDIEKIRLMEKENLLFQYKDPTDTLFSRNYEEMAPLNPDDVTKQHKRIFSSNRADLFV